MVGTQTALLDNPSLTVRHWVGESPVRVVLDRTLRIPPHYHLLDASVKTLLFTEKEATNKENVEYITVDFSRSVLPQVMSELYARKLNSLMVEGGATLLGHFIEEGLWDCMLVETVPVKLSSGVPAPNPTRDAMLILAEFKKVQDHAISIFSRKGYPF